MYHEHVEGGTQDNSPGVQVSIIRFHGGLFGDIVLDQFTQEHGLSYSVGKQTRSN